MSRVVPLSVAYRDPGDLRAMAELGRTVVGALARYGVDGQATFDVQVGETVADANRIRAARVPVEMSHLAALCETEGAAGRLMRVTLPSGVSFVGRPSLAGSSVVLRHATRDEVAHVVDLRAVAAVTAIAVARPAPKTEERIADLTSEGLTEHEAAS